MDAQYIGHKKKIRDKFSVCNTTKIRSNGEGDEVGKVVDQDAT